MATALTPQTDVTSGEAYRKENWLKTQLIFILFFIFFIKSETSDSSVIYFDGHFAYLKTLDFYFKVGERSFVRSVLLYIYRDLKVKVQGF